VTVTCFATGGLLWGRFENSDEASRKRSCLLYLSTIRRILVARIPEGILRKQGGDAGEAIIHFKARSGSFLSLDLYCCPCPHLISEEKQEVKHGPF
jgi:hypothetical protein